MIPKASYLTTDVRSLNSGFEPRRNTFRSSSQIWSPNTELYRCSRRRSASSQTKRRFSAFPVLWSWMN